MAKKAVEQQPVRVRHFMADGREVESMDGYVIPEGHPFYRVYARIITNIAERQSKEEEAKSHASTA